jgi:hypothetical protein
VRSIKAITKTNNSTVIRIMEIASFLGYFSRSKRKNSRNNGIHVVVWVTKDQNPSYSSIPRLFR